jgi:hypothetical protein
MARRILVVCDVRMSGASVTDVTNAAECLWLSRLRYLSGYPSRRLKHDGLLSHNAHMWQKRKYETPKKKIQEIKIISPPKGSLTRSTRNHEHMSRQRRMLSPSQKS